jgi:hypothetical protein
MSFPFIGETGAENRETGLLILRLASVDCATGRLNRSSLDAFDRSLDTTLQQ